MKKFTAGKDYIKYNEPIFGKEEISAVLKTLKDGWLVPGKVTAAFETAVARLFGKKHALFVNSGSSANLLSFEALALPKGGEVITPACTFATTVNPILQKGLVPVLVDSELGGYQADIGEIEKAITKKTVALMIPNLIGNIPDIRKISRLAKKHKLVYIEDSCDTLGATLNGTPTGAWSTISTTSFYASHIITTAGAGGMLLTDDKDTFARAEVFRSWGRSIPYYWEDLDRRLKNKLNGVTYDGKFIFSEIGYNFIPIEIQAAFGLAQLEKLPRYKATREKNFATVAKFFSRYEHFFILPKTLLGIKTAWLAFPLTIRDNAPFSREQFVRFLEENKIQTRPLFSGNILYHPAYKHIPHKTIGSLPHATTILKHSLLIGIHHGMTAPMAEYMLETCENFLKRYH